MAWRRAWQCNCFIRFHQPSSIVLTVGLVTHLARLPSNDKIETFCSIMAKGIHLPQYSSEVMIRMECGEEARWNLVAFYNWREIFFDV
jgi:hypothetical protein